VTQTRRGAAGEDTVRFIVDFQGGGLAADAAVEPSVWCDAHGEVLEQRAYPNEVAGGWRMVLTVRRKDRDEPVELRGALSAAGAPASETWSYLWPPS
jgi:glucan biosynthesis protein